MHGRNLEDKTQYKRGTAAMVSQPVQLNADSIAINRHSWINPT